MVSTARRLFRNGRALIRAFGERGIEKNFQRIHHFKCPPTKKLSDFVLSCSQEALIEELEKELDPNVRQALTDYLLEIETEMKKRNLLSDNELTTV